MSVLQKGILYIDADVNGDGTEEAGVFHMQGNAEITTASRTGYLLSDAGGQINAFLGSLLGDGQSRQEGIFLNLGGGTRTWTIAWRGWEGSDLQWGNTGSGGTASDATGEDPLSQMDVLLEYISVADIDSTKTATFEYGEHWTGGRYDPVDVVIEQPQMTRSAEDGSWFDGDMTLLAAADLKSAYDAQEQNEY